MFKIIFNDSCDKLSNENALVFTHLKEMVDALNCQYVEFEIYLQKTTLSTEGIYTAVVLENGSFRIKGKDNSVFFVEEINSIINNAFTEGTLAKNESGFIHHPIIIIPKHFLEDMKKIKNIVADNNDIKTFFKSYDLSSLYVFKLEYKDNKFITSFIEKKGLMKEKTIFIDGI